LAASESTHSGQSPSLPYPASGLAQARENFGFRSTYGPCRWLRAEMLVEEGLHLVELDVRLRIDDIEE